MRTWLVLLAALGLVGACAGGPSDPGTMTTEQYRSLEARGADLTVQDVVDRGAVESADLEQTFVAEGGQAADPSLECYYAETTRRAKYRGVARFCFADGAVESVERNRGDLR